MTPGPEGGSRVAVFAKAPVPGEVKTRLVPLLGAEGAARLQEALVRRALAIAAESAVGDVELWCAPHADHPFFERCARELGVRTRSQPAGDLGRRMQAAFDAAFADGRALVLVGSDCPALSAADLREAREALRTHDAAFTPAEDGGYVLVAMARPVAGVFEGVDWGTGRVMRQTRERLAAAGARVRELPVRWDVDRPEDYARLAREGLLPEAAA